MHALLITCILFEAIFISALVFWIRRLNTATGERFEAFIQSSRKFSDLVWEEIAKRDRRISLLSESHQLQADKHAELDCGVSRMRDNVNSSLGVISSKINDISEGCERIDADLTEVMADVRELSKLHAEEAREFSERVSEIAGKQEEIRRKAARPGAAGFAWEPVKNRAESNSGAVDPEHARLVALAEGSGGV